MYFISDVSCIEDPGVLDNRWLELIPVLPEGNDFLSELDDAS